jgi:hypothetical protein
MHQNQHGRPAERSRSKPDQYQQQSPYDDRYRQPQPAGYAPALRETLPSSAATRRSGRTFSPEMSAGGTFWYILGCIAMGAMYFAKVPCKKALEQAGLGTMTSAERFWYVLGCIPFGAFSIPR